MAQYPENLALTDAQIIETIAQRWSPFAFSDKPIGEDVMAQLFEAARWAPSSFNEQPWIYIYALKSDGEKRALLESLLAQGNAWAKEAPLLIVSIAKQTFKHNGKDNRHALHDTGCASGYMMLQVTDLGLVGHQMAGFDAERAVKELKLPANCTAGSMIAIGYPGDPQILPAPLLERQNQPRSRNPVSAFAFRGQYQA